MRFANALFSRPFPFFHAVSPVALAKEMSFAGARRTSRDVIMAPALVLVSVGPCPRARLVGDGTPSGWPFRCCYANSTQHRAN